MFGKIISVTLVILAFGWAAQRLINKYTNDNEHLRKLVHVCHGVGIAILAFMVPFSVLLAIEIIILLSMFIVRYVNGHFSFIPWIKYFGKVYQVGRVSYGEFFYPLSMIIALFIADSHWEFAAAALILALADAAAAVAGKRFGRLTTYKILGHKKSLVGSGAFFLTAYAIIGTFILMSGADVSSEIGLASLLWVSLALTITENLGIYGSDNLLIPIVAVVLLNQL